MPRKFTVEWMSNINKRSMRIDTRVLYYGIVLLLFSVAFFTLVASVGASNQVGNVTIDSALVDTESDNSSISTSAGSAKSTWETLTTKNPGYEVVGLDKFHSNVSSQNRGEGVDIVVIDSGFDFDHPLYNPVKDGEKFREYHVNVVGTWCGGGILGCDEGVIEQFT
jgi:hypothetical protein